MTDETPKKAWARCPACSTVYPNIQIAKDGHRENCPLEIRLRLKKLEEERIPALEQKILDLGGNLDEISSDPGIDFTGVEDDVEEGEEDTSEVSVYDQAVAPVSGISATPSDGWDDDEDDDPALTTSANLLR